MARVITHGDGAMGFLTVLPQYRRRGYASDLTVALIKRLRWQDKVAYVHIEEEDINSISLAEKIGFVRGRRIHWLKLASRNDKI